MNYPIHTYNKTMNFSVLTASWHYCALNLECSSEAHVLNVERQLTPLELRPRWLEYITVWPFEEPMSSLVSAPFDCRACISVMFSIWFQKTVKTSKPQLWPGTLWTTPNSASWEVRSLAVPAVPLIIVNALLHHTGRKALSSRAVNDINCFRGMVLNYY